MRPKAARCRRSTCERRARWPKGRRLVTPQYCTLRCAAEDALEITVWWCEEHGGWHDDSCWECEADEEDRTMEDDNA